MHPLHTEATPQDNLFTLLARRSGSLWIDPVLGSEAGLKLGGLALQLSAERLGRRAAARLPNA